MAMGSFTAAIGLSLDASGFGMGQRAQRFGMIVEDGTVTYLGIEAPGEIKVSSADAILAAALVKLDCHRGSSDTKRRITAT